MRINNNLMAMNTHRQLSINGSNTQKSIEKLSSGYRINRAGDDAAGLAISEKMRAQIRGLDQASRNSQDSISLIQTAEGALGETQSILQRMRELAVQSANDTNVDADRSEIQKEINQLTSEINRIGNTTEFNNQQLLSGEISITGDGRAIKTATFDNSGGANILEAGTTIAEESGLETGNYSVTVSSSVVSQSVSGPSEVTNASVNGGTVTLAEGSYKVAIAQDDVKVIENTEADNYLNTAGGNSAITVESNSNLADGNDYSIQVDKSKSATALSGSGVTVDSSAGDADAATDGTYIVETATVIDAGSISVTNSVDSIISNVSIESDSAYADDGSNTITVTATNAGSFGTDGQIELTFTAAGDSTATTTTTITAADAGARSIQLGDITFDLDLDAVWADATASSGTAALEDGDSSSFAGGVLTLDDGAIKNQITVTQASTGAEVQVQLDRDANATGQAFDFSTDGGSGTLELNMTAADFVGGNTINTTVNSEYDIVLQKNNVDIGSAVTLTSLDLADSANVTNISLGDVGNGISVDLDSTVLTAAGLGSNDITFEVNTGTAFTAQVQDADGGNPDATYTINDDGSTNISLSDDVSLDFVYGDLAEGDVYFSVKDGVTTYEMKLTNDDTSTDVETVEFTAGDKAVFTSGVEVATDAAVADAETATFEVEDTEVDNSLSMQVGANKGQSFSVDISDMRSTALGVAGTTASATADGVGTEAAGASFVATKDVTDGTSSTGTEYALDVSSHEKATAAVEVINQAIEAVSAERSKLGAFQNRLEYTIRNLDTSSENLQASESRIRDVDMAKEMMEFTKNNILQQAAQSMLAQANQQPQGVLQLLR